MNVKVIKLPYTQGIRGFDIQGLQKSNYFAGKSIEDIGIHSINPGNERGGHYHKEKTEWLLPLSGKALFVWTDKISPKPDDLNSISIKADYKELALIEVPPLVPHWVKNVDSEIFVMIAFSSKDFNEEQPDSFKVSTNLV